jgi:ribosome-binding protein aMBF1 (putative translation factor)
VDSENQKSLQAAGFRIGDAEDFLALTDEERRLVELRVAISRAVRRLRQRKHLTQQQLAAKLKSSQSRVAKIEAGAADVSLDLLFRGLFAVGGELTDLTSRAETTPPGRSSSRSG